MKQPGFFDDDPAEAKRARDAALARIAENAGDWRERALLSISVVSGFSGTAEDLRLTLLKNGLSEPHHHNAWGEVIKKAISGGLLIPTGEMRHMRTVKSHARRTPVYRSRI